MTTLLTEPESGVLPAREADTGPARGALRFVVQVVSWLVILIVLGILALAVAVPRATGSTPYTVLTGSMSPTYPAGTLLVDEQVDPKDIHLGDAVTFQIASGRPEVVTHRVVAVRPDLEGNLEFLTKGDANEFNDEEWRPSESVRGRVWYAVPHLGRLNTLISGNQRQLAVYAAATALVIYAGAMFAGAGRDRRRAVTPAHRA